MEAIITRLSSTSSVVGADKFKPGVKQRDEDYAAKNHGFIVIIPPFDVIKARNSLPFFFSSSSPPCPEHMHVMR